MSRAHNKCFLTHFSVCLQIACGSEHNLAVVGEYNEPGCLSYRKSNIWWPQKYLDILFIFFILFYFVT